MFSGCEKLKILDLSNFNFNFSSIWYRSYLNEMFYKCDFLEYLNLYSFLYENKSQSLIDDLFYYVPNNTIFCVKDDETKKYFISKNKILKCFDIGYNEHNTKNDIINSKLNEEFELYFVNINNSNISYSYDMTKNILLITIDNNTDILIKKEI